MLRIESLVETHKELSGLIESVRRLNPSQDGQAIADGLSQFGKVLVAHLAVEDAELYPALRVAGEKTGAPLSLKTNIKMFFDEMEKLKPVVTGFLGKWTSAGVAANPEGFKDEFAKIAKTFSDRAVREEARLYTLYTEHCH